MQKIKATEDGLCCPENVSYGSAGSKVPQQRIFSALFDTTVGEMLIGPEGFGQVSG